MPGIHTWLLFKQTFAALKDLIHHNHFTLQKGQVFLYALYYNLHSMHLHLQKKQFCNIKKNIQKAVVKVF